MYEDIPRKDCCVIAIVHCVLHSARIPVNNADRHGNGVTTKTWTGSLAAKASGLHPVHPRFESLSVYPPAFHILKDTFHFMKTSGSGPLWYFAENLDDLER